MMYPAVKRAMDVALAGGALVAMAPVMAAVAAVVALGLGRPVLFRQARPGRGGKIFECLKFRTMTDGRDAQGAPLPDEQRIGRLGLLLRQTSLDELPQLWNILKGEMSLVGPRPLMVRYLERYTPEQNRRHLVKPGITGWAQVNGRNLIDWDRKLALDTWYVDHRSLWLDVRILFKTAWIVLTGAGVARPGEASMAEFMGSRPPEALRK